MQRASSSSGYEHLCKGIVAQGDKPNTAFSPLRNVMVFVWFLRL